MKYDSHSAARAKSESHISFDSVDTVQEDETDIKKISLPPLPSLIHKISFFVESYTPLHRPYQSLSEIAAMRQITAVSRLTGGITESGVTALYCFPPGVLV